jgi:hypothetical protein
LVASSDVRTELSVRDVTARRSRFAIVPRSNLARVVKSPVSNGSPSELRALCPGLGRR